MHFLDCWIWSSRDPTTSSSAWRRKSGRATPESYRRVCASRCLPGSPRYPVVPSIGSRGLSALPCHHTRSVSDAVLEPLLHMTIAQGPRPRHPRPRHGYILTYCGNIEKSFSALFSSQAATNSQAASFLKICGSTTVATEPSPSRRLPLQAALPKRLMTSSPLYVVHALSCGGPSAGPPQRQAPSRLLSRGFDDELRDFVRMGD
jgi:hypothetical protein